MKTIKTKLAGVILLVLASASLFLTCDVGLGNSVDTKPPTVSITYPPVQSVIKNTFTMKGASADETSLASVTVSVLNTVNAKSYGPYQATLDATAKSWSVVINNSNAGAFEIPDGTYEMTATAKDGAGRTSTAKTTYKIDNTPPVVVLERPGTVGPIAGTAPEVYGTELKVTGSINDDNAVEKLIFTPYSSAGVQLEDASSNKLSFTVSNISGTGMDVTLAKKIATPSTADDIALNNRYTAIYESAVGGTQSFYCTISVSDEAREYNPPASVASADNTRGNTNAQYYIYDEIYSTVFSAGGDAVSMKDLTAIFNGTYADTSKAATVKTHLAAKAHSVAPWSSASGTFSLNPDNSPKYEVTSLDPITVAKPIDSITKSNAADFSILISAGRDKVPLEPDSFRVYLDPCGSSGAVPVQGVSDDIILLDTVANLSGNASAIAARNAMLSKSGTDYVASVNIGTLTTKNNYLLKIEGLDQEGNSLVGSDYGFRVVMNGKPPVINFTSPANLAVYKYDASFPMSGTVTSESGLTGLKADYTVKNVSTGAAVSRSVAGLAPASGNNWTFSIDPSSDTTTTDSYEYTVTMTADDDAGNTTTASRVFYIDREPPTVEINTISPTVNVSGTEYANGKVNIKWRPADNDKLASVTWSTDGGVTNTPITNFSGWTTTTIDTTAFTSTTGSFTFSVTATDVAGNTYTKDTTIQIDQSTDKPVVTLSNASASVAAASGVTASSNLFDLSGNNKLLGTVSDDDGIASIVITTRKASDDSLVDTKTLTPSGSPTTSLSYQLPAVEDVYKIEIVATDTNTPVGTANAPCVFYVGVDAGSPSLSISSPAQYLYSKGDINVTGTVTDGSGVVTLKRGAADVTVSSGTWTDTFTASATNGDQHETYTATDKYGRTSDVQFWYKVDATIPTITPDSAAVWIKKESPFIVKGSAKDTPSYVEGVYSKLLPVSTAAPLSVDGTWTPASGTWSHIAGNNDPWTVSVDLSSDAEGDYKLYLASKDAAGNYSLIQPVLIHADSADPSFAFTGSPADSQSADFILKGTASDTYFNDLSYTRTGVLPGTASGTILSSSGSWTLPQAGLADDKYTYTFTATDKAGRTKSVVYNMTYDTQPPLLSISGIASVVTTSPLVISGTASDAGSGVSLVEYSWDNISWLPADGTTNWNKSVALGSEGAKTLYVRAKDSAGHLSVGSASFSYDVSAPSLTETAIGSGGAKKNADFSIGGAASDSNSLKTWDDPSDGSPTLVPYVEVSENGGASTKVTVSGGNWTYNKTVDPAGANDGDVTFSIKATDAVGNEKTVSRTVTIDATAPVISLDGVIAGLNAGQNKVNGVMSVRFSANDTGVGLEKSGSAYQAYYKIVAKNAATPTTASDIAGWTSITSSGSIFNFTYDTNGGSTPAGDYDLYVGIRDAVTGAPNASFAKLTLSIDQESDRPTITFDNLVATATSNWENGFGNNPAILLTVEDDDKVKVSDLEYRIDINNDGDFNDTYDFWNGTTLGADGDTGDKWEDESVWYPVEQVPSSDSSLAQAKIKLTNFPQGSFRIQVRARDTVDASAWASIYGDASNYHWKESPAVRFAVDYGPPSITVSAPTAGSFNSNFTLTGIAADALGVIKVRYTLDGGSSYTTLYSNATGVLSEPFSGTVDISSLVTGSYTLQVEATDIGGTTATQQIPISIDKTAPTATLLQPAAGAVLNGSSVTVRGEAYDNRQLDSVYLWHGKVSDPDPTLPTLSNPGGYTKVGTSNIWSSTIDTTGTVLTAANGYRIRVVAVDTLGNVGVPVDYPVTVDQASDRPVITFSNLDTGTPSRLALGNLSIIGTVTDDDSVLKSSIQIRIDRNGDGDFNDANEGWVPISNPPTANALVVSWTHVITDITTEGLHYVQIRALDIDDAAGDYATGYHWSASAPVAFYIDNGPPALVVASPSNSQRFNVDHFTLTGTTQDTNGIKRVVIWVDNNGDSVVDAGEQTTITGSAGAPLTTDNTLYTINQTISGLTDGVKAVRVSSYDSSDALTVRDFSVVVDTTAPSATITAPASGSTLNGTVQVVGTATDNYAVSEVWYNISASGSTPSFPSDYARLTNQTYSWSFPFDTSSYPDGNYRLSVVVVDSATNTSAAAPATCNFSINQNTDKPVVKVLTLTEAAPAVENLLPSSLAVSGTVSDDDSVDKSKLQIRYRAIGAPSWSAWAAISAPPTSNTAFATWGHAFTGLTDGKYEFELRAADIYDDGTWNASAHSWTEFGPVQFAVDLSLPTSTIDAPAQASYFNTDVAIGGTASDASGIKKVTIAYDTGSGYGGESTLYEDTVSADGYDASKAWSTTYQKSNGDGQVFFRVTVTDAFNKVRTYEQYFTIDTSAPTVSFDSPSMNPNTATGAYNETVTFKGTADDNRQVTKIYYLFAASDPGAPDASFTGWTLASGTNSWTATVNTRTVNDAASDQAYHLYVVGVDASKNVSTRKDLSFTINQGSDRPVLTLLAPTANQVFDANAQASGSVSDDDGLSKIEIRIDRNNDGDFLDANEGYVDVDSPSTVSGKNLNLSHVLSSLSDGSYRLQIRVRDSNFVDTATTPFNEYESAVVNFSIDAHPPVVTPTKLTVQNRYGAADTVITSGFNGSYVNNDFTLSFAASDDNGLYATDPVQVSLDNSTWVYAATAAGGGIYDVTIPVSAFSDGTQTIYYRVRNSFGKVTTGLVTILVDKTEPTVSFNSPSGVSMTSTDEAPNVNGTAVTVTGAVSDASVIDSLVLTGGVDQVNHKISFANTGNKTNWSFTFDSTLYDNETYATPNGTNVTVNAGTDRFAAANHGFHIGDKVEFYAPTMPGNIAVNTSYYVIAENFDANAFEVSATADGSKVDVTSLPTGNLVAALNGVTWRLPVTVTAYDHAGNRVDTTKNTGYIDLDPNGDKPIVIISTPSAGASVTGIITLTGTVSDDDGTSGTVDIALDTNNDGAYTDETYPGVAVTNGAWSKQINTSGSLSGTISFKVTPHDVNGLAGDPMTRTVFIDSSLPSIVGTGGVVSTTPTPATGTRQNGTITVNAAIKDDDSIPNANIQVSLDGGSTYVAVSSIAGATISSESTITESSKTYKYKNISFPINTATYFANGSDKNPGNGSMSVILQVTDNTYKPAVVSLSYAVDNRPPEAFFDPLSTLTSQSGVYSFAGSGTTSTNKVIGKVADGGSVSGVSYVDVYFVKNVSGNRLYDPKAGGYTTSINTSTTAYVQLAFQTSAVLTAADTITLDRTNATTGLGAPDNSMPVRFIGGTLPGGLDSSTLYYVRDVSGNDFSLYTVPSGGTKIDLSDTGSGDMYMEYASSGMPFVSDAYTDSTASGHYAIRINKQTELGTYDSVGGVGDQDGFQESLKDKGGYYEWFSYFDTTKLPDGPLSVYYAAYDETGNKVVGKVAGQIANNPPSMSSVTVNSTTVSASPWKFKATGTSIPVTLTAADTNAGASIDAAGWKLEVLGRYGSGIDVSASADTTYSNWFYGSAAGNVRDFATRNSGTPATGTVDITISGGTGLESNFAEGYWYKLKGTAVDADGNIATQEFYLKVYNSDSNRPVVKTSAGADNDYDSFGQSNLIDGHIEDAGSVTFSATATSVTSASVLTSTALINNAFIRTGWTITDSALGQNRTISAFNAATGQITVSPAFGSTPSAGDALVIANPALVSGTITLTGKVYDDTDVSSVRVRISYDGGSTFTLLGNATLSGKTGDVINGYTYNWTYNWDTSTVTGVAHGNVLVYADAADAVNYGAAVSKDVDVVPYIKSVTDPNGLSVDVLRSSTGKYSVANDASKTMTITGYNFASGCTAKVSTATAIIPGTALSLTPGYVSATQLSLTKAAASLSKSGNLTISVNGVASPNNVNNNGAARNIEYISSNPRSKQWTDDRYLWVWGTKQINITTAVGFTLGVLSYSNPDMIVNPTNDQPEFSWNDINAGNTLYNTSDSSATRRYGFRVTRPAAMATATVSGATQRFILSGMDAVLSAAGDLDSGYFELTGFADQTTDGYADAQAPSTASDGQKWMTIMGVDYYQDNGSDVKDYRVFSRVPHPKLIAESSSVAGSASIYASYYDASPYAGFQSLNFVSFRTDGQRSSNLTYPANDYSRSPNVITIPGTSGGRSSPYYDMVKMGSKSIAIAYYDALNAKLKLAYSTNAYASTGVALTDNLTNSTGTCREKVTISLTNNTRTRYANKYFTLYNETTACDVWYDTTGSASKPAGCTAPNSIKVDISGTAASAANFCDATITAIRGNLAFPYFKDSASASGAASQVITVNEFGPTTDASPGNMATATAVGTVTVSTQGASTWNTIDIDASGNVGQYVSLVTDGAGKLYVSYYDFDNANLKLARLSWNSGTPSVDGTVNIDNYLSAGSWTNIMMLTNASVTGQSTAQPVIAYYSDSYNGTAKPIRFAFPRFNAASGTMSNGTESSLADEYSGNWEVVTVPAVSVPQGGADTFNQVQLGAYSSGALPVLGWVGTKLEYSKLQPNN